MRTYLPKQNQTQRPSSSSLSRPSIAPRVLRTDVEELKAGSAGTASPRFNVDFSRIPVCPPEAPVIQTKLAINNPGDADEHEADRISEKVTEMSEPQLVHARQVTGSPIAHEVLRSPGHNKGLQVSQGMQSQIEGLRGRGQQLPESLRSYFEPRFGYDFGNVRVHTGSQAAEAAHGMNAKAFTVGRDVAFGAGQYSPETSAGKRLLAHELAHVIQQNGGAPGRLDGARQGFAIQRKPETEYGLAKLGSRNKYVAEAIRLWTQQKSMTVEAFADAMMTEIKTDLLGQGVPELKWKMSPGVGESGRFDSTKWLVEINPNAFSDTKVTTVADLTPQQIEEIVGTLYHESRHTDQDVLIVRVLLDQKKSVNEIASATHIPARIIQAVQAATFKTPLDREQVAHANRMFEVMYGKHKELLTFLMEQPQTVAGVSELVNASSADDLDDAAPHVKKLAEWAKDILDPKVKRLAAGKKVEQLEATLKEDLGVLNQETAKLQAAFNTATKSPTKAAMNGLHTSAETWGKKLVAAYKNLEGEKDAFRVEELVKKEFKKKAEAKAKSTPPEKK